MSTERSSGFARAFPWNRRLSPGVPQESRVEALEKELEEWKRYAEDPENPLFDAGWQAGYGRGRQKIADAEARAQRLRDALEKLLPGEHCISTYRGFTDPDHYVHWTWKVGDVIAAYELVLSDLPGGQHD